MLENVQGLKVLPIPLNGGIDEVSPVDSLLPEDAIKMINWRLSKDGKRIQKRAGLQEEDTAFGEDVYGYATYQDATPSFCKIAVLESEIQRKVGAGAWANIFDFSSNIDHSVKVLEIQDKQFIITEKGSRVVQADGGVRQIGISKPTTIPSAVATYVTVSAPPLTELFAYADTAAMTAAGWADIDVGGGSASTLSTTDPNGDVGPDADSKYLRMVCTGGFAVYAGRRKTLTTPITSNFGVEIECYFDVLTLAAGIGGIHAHLDNGDKIIKIVVGNDGAYVQELNGNFRKIVDIIVPINKWIRWNFSISKEEDILGIKVEGFCSYDSVVKGSGGATLFPPVSENPGRIELQTWGNSDNYIDHFRIDTAESGSAVVVGLYRYAVSFLREGNYGCESNAIKSSIGTISFTGAGVNDMTLDDESEYTGPTSKVLRVNVKTAANPDIIQWSEDGGVTWKSQIPIAAKVYLGYGIIVNFATLTGHTATDYWEIPCNTCSAIATNQQIELSSIPTSSDQQVTARKIYRSTSGGAKFYYLTTLYDRATTTTFIDNFPDAALGDELEEDRDLFSEASSTIGKFAEWWDNRLWIADAGENLIYYSAIRTGGPVPEEFSIDERFVPVMRGDQDDTITAMKAYKDALYVFKRNDIFVIQKTALGYAPYHLNSDLGCIADNCVEVVNDFLMFPSERGIELYDGVKAYSPEFSVVVDRTFRTADPAGYKYMTMAHDKEFNELWLSIPSRLSGAAAITVAWNYIKNKFYFFQFYKVPSWIGRCKDSTGKSVLKMGTRDGCVLLCDYGTADNTTAILATYRKGWMDLESHGISRLIKVDYEIPAGKTLTCNVYVNMQENPFRTSPFTGEDIGSGDLESRRPIGDKAELGLRHRWVSIEFTNDEDCEGELKINDAFLFVRPGAIQDKTYGAANTPDVSIIDGGGPIDPTDVVEEP